MQVRWADLEALKQEKRRREVGFSLGSSWNKMSEEEVERILLHGTAETANDD